LLMQASDGRMDAMAVALGWSGIAAYLLLRERRFLLAIALSCSLAAMAVFTHPNALVIAILLVITALYFDRARIRCRAMAIAALPFFAIAAAWCLYVAQSPADFQAQFLGNAAGRGPTFTTPIAALSLEITHRYMDSYGLAAWSSLTGRLNVIPLLMFLAALVVCLCTPAIRRQPGYRLLLIWTLVVMSFLTELEGLKTHFYLIYVTPLYSVLLAVALAWMWTRLARWRWLLTAAILLFVGLQALRTTSGAWHNRRQLAYDPAVQYLRTHTDPKTFTMGGAGLAFGLGPDWNLLDDTRLGYNSGKRPKLVVIDPTWDDAILMMQSNAPAIHSYLTRLLETEYREVYNHAGYRVLARLSAQEPVHD